MALVQIPCLMAGFLVVQAKSQFAHPRAVLLPEFAGPHLFVLVLLLVVGLVFWPILVGGGLGLRAINLMAFGVTVAALSLWGMHRNNWFGIVAIGIFLSGVFPWQGNWWFREAQPHQTVHVLILLAGWPAIIAWLWRLTQLREEADDYQLVFYVGRGKTGGESSERRRLIARAIARQRLLAWLGDRWHARLPKLHAENRSSLAHILQYGFGAAPPVYSAVMGSAMMIAVSVAWLWGYHAVVADKIPINGIWFYFLLYTSLPGNLAGLALAERRPRISAELLFPLTRPRLIDALLLASARNTVVFWLAMNIGLLMVARWMLGSQFTLAAASVYLLLSIAIGAAGFGAGIRTSLWDSLMQRLVAAGIGGCLGMGALALWWSLRGSVGDGPFVGLALAIAAIGAWLTHKGRQAWLSFELG